MDSIDDTLIALAEELGKVLTANCEKIATAESCTGGLLAAIITEIPGSSAWFDRGFVTYSNQAKMDMLGVKSETLDQFGAVSEQTAREMAAGAIAHSQADWAIAITGIAGPGGGSPEKPVGTVFIALKKRGKSVETTTLKLKGNRQEIRLKTVCTTFENLIVSLNRT